MATRQVQRAPRQNPNPSITASITRGSGTGSSVTVDSGEIIELIKKIRGNNLGDDGSNPGLITIGRQALGDNHLFTGNDDTTISNVHIQVTPIEEDSVRVHHCGKFGGLSISVGSTTEMLSPNETKDFPLPIDISFGKPIIVISIVHEDSGTTFDDGICSWEDLSNEQRAVDNKIIKKSTNIGFKQFCSLLLEPFSAQSVIIATRNEILASAGKKISPADHAKIWQWYTFNGRAYRLIRNLTTISIADGSLPIIGNAIVFRLFQGGVYLIVTKDDEEFTAIDRERLTRIAWYTLCNNRMHTDWFPRMHIEDTEPGHLHQIVTHYLINDPLMTSSGQAASVQQLAARVTRDTGIIFPRPTKKKLSLNSGLDIPRRHMGIAQASQNRYYYRLTDILTMFVSDYTNDVAPECKK